MGLIFRVEVLGDKRACRSRPAPTVGVAVGYWEDRGGNGVGIGVEWKAQPMGDREGGEGLCCRLRGR